MSIHSSIPVIGLVGGVCSGKSSVGRWVGSRHNLTIIEADQIGHKVLAFPSVKQQLSLQFGDSILNDQGDVDRSVLGRLVFGSDSSEQQARTQLEAIVHPEIRNRIQEELEKAKQALPVDAVILDAAVLYEANWDDLCDVVIFVDVARPQRLQRARESRGWTEKEFHLRESSQLPLETKRRRADYTIDNSGTLSDAGMALERILLHINNATR